MDKRTILYPAASFVVAFGISLGVGQAISHASDVNWDAIAQCESGGNWHANTGNGFYGGLQFTLQTWQANGGSGNPANASRAEQIRVAENVVSSQGLGAWPECGVEAYSHSAQAKKAPQEPSQPLPTSPWKPRPKPHPDRPFPALLPGWNKWHCSDWDYTGYVVKGGDTLSSIGRKFNMPWKKIFQDESNRKYILNPNLIYPNEVVCIPFNTSQDGMH
jgi:hypothetical protein